MRTPVRRTVFVTAVAAALLGGCTKAAPADGSGSGGNATGGSGGNASGGRAGVGGAAGMTNGGGGGATAGASGGPGGTSPGGSGGRAGGSGGTAGGGGGDGAGSGGRAATDGGAVVDAPAATDGPATPACVASARPAIGALGLQTVFSGGDLNGVSYAVQSPGSNDWYLVEQRGRIMVLNDGALRPTPFFDAQSEIVPLDATYDERGLHAIAFAPDYATSGLFYITLVPTKGARANRDLLLEHKRSAADPYVADKTATREILNLAGSTKTDLFANIHNAYQVTFGPDGKLYLGMGDGGGTCNNNAGFENTPQDISSPYGKLLRFDLAAPPPYGAADNPFVGTGDARVLHYGLRNPFRFAWDSLTGDLYIGEVGQDTHEELNVARSGAKGVNFGWPAREGTESKCAGRALRAGSDPTPPIFFTDHGGGGIHPVCDTSPFCDYSAIVGGTVYRGTTVASLRGAYLFGDWNGDNMGALYHCAGTTSPVTVIDYVRDLNLPSNGYFVKVGANVPSLASITAIIEGHDKELYLVANGNSLLKIVPAP